MSGAICKTPGCKNEQKPGRRFCNDCSDRLDQIKQDLDSDPKSLFNRGTDKRPKSKRKVPTCCYLGCWDERQPGEPYCAFHADEPINE